jgi:threonine dehydratase
MARALVDDYVVVDTDAVCAAIKDVFQDTRSILEPSGALGVAAIKQYVAAQGQGQDLRHHHLRREHELRPPALRRRARRGRRAARGAVRGHHPRGARLVQALLRADRPARGHRVQLPHRRRQARAPVSSACRSRARRGRAHRARQLRASRLSHAGPDRRRAGQGTPAPHGRRPFELAQGRAAVPLRLSRTPGRADALPVVAAPGWNISLFHYRNQGADYGRILVGMQVPKADEREFKAFLQALAYPCVEESDNPVYRLFLR